MKPQPLQTFPIQPHLSHTHPLKTMIKQVLQQFPTIHTLLNNPPILPHNLLIPIKQKHSHPLINTNLKPTFNSIQKLTPHIFRQKQPSILNLTTILRQIPNPPQPNYLPSKPALIPLTKSAAKQLPSTNITLNPLPPR
ncbi:SDR family NAD(P)-dependent oxidoreductase, partial [Staphylococcus auricularis]|uniref:SDR family NAD(P)-dependent oxidoreductase n=1 Tax=Staphylococcus auricularis TaxID=29379 RepID=UPI0012463A29